MTNEKKHERRIKKHKPKAKKLQFTLIIIIVLACILAYYFDFLQNFSLDPSTEVSQDNNATSVNKRPNDTNDESDTDASYTEIRIKGEIILYEGDVLTLKELNDKLQNKSNEYTIIRLVDNISIHAIFTSVEDLLKELDLKYIIIEDGNL